MLSVPKACGERGKRIIVPIIHSECSEWMMVASTERKAPDLQFGVVHIALIIVESFLTRESVTAISRGRSAICGFGVRYELCA